MKLNLLAAGMVGALAFGGLSAPAMADGDEDAASGFSGTVTLTSDYRFRGVSQSDTGAALQASLDYAHESGLYFSVWGSTIDFSPFGDPDSRIEIDLTAGYDIALSDQTTVGTKFVYYWYADADIAPGDPEYNYYEIFGSISHNFGKATLSAEVAWTDDYSGELGSATAITGGLEVPLYKELWIFDGGVVGSFHAGHQSFDDELEEDYGYWDLGVKASIDRFDLDVRYTDAGLDKFDCGPDVCDGTVVFSLTANLGN
jgi:uncharacterized protein (TIGR02001 family)